MTRPLLQTTSPGAGGWTPVLVAFAGSRSGCSWAAMPRRGPDPGQVPGRGQKSLPCLCSWLTPGTTPGPGSTLGPFHVALQAAHGVGTGSAPGQPSGSPPLPCPPPEESPPGPGRAQHGGLPRHPAHHGYKTLSSHARFCSLSKVRAQIEAGTLGTGTSAPTGHTRNGSEP